MERYSGFFGRIRILKERIQNWISKNGEPPVGSRAWEAKLEVEKLPRIIDERLNRLSKGDLDADAEASLQADIENLQQQLDRHQQTLDEMDANPGVGFFAAQGTHDKFFKDNVPQDVFKRSELPRDIQDWDSFFNNFFVSQQQDGTFTITRRDTSKILEGYKFEYDTGKPGDLSQARIVKKQELDTSYPARKSRAAQENSQRLEDFPELEDALETRQKESNWTSEDIGQIRKWADVIEKLQSQMGGSNGLNLDNLLKDIPAEYKEKHYEQFRHQLRDKTIQAILTEPDGSKRQELLQEFLDLQPDPKSKGELFTAFRKQTQGENIEGIREKDTALKLDNETGRVADDVISVTDDIEAGPPVGKYLVEDKAGPGAFKLDQAKDYFESLDPVNGTVKTKDGKQYNGIVYFFDSRESAQNAKRIIQGLSHKEKIYVGYYNAQSKLEWLPIE
jgi:peptide methionine sulfoxide reductase MsrA